ncbi:MAG TPA: fumarate hydratase C-terminal domain-containing protein [bacterium]|nr:fumarate hydratase C-terminal domain-containing protein [bacterium]
MKFSGGMTEDMLNAGTVTRITGELITVRDQSLKKIVEMVKAGEKLPFETQNAYIFFAAPTPGYTENRASIGPTTSWRMGAFIPFLLDLGVKGFIGKGFLPEGVPEAIRRKKALYFQALGGAGAYYGSQMTAMEPIMFPELGPEAVFKIEVADFPLIISIDTRGAIFS